MKTIVIVKTYIRALIGCPLWHIAVHIRGATRISKAISQKKDFGDPLKLIQKVLERCLEYHSSPRTAALHETCALHVSTPY